jgi:hypothetical protein
MWEVFSKGAQPFAGYSNAEVISKVTEEMEILSQPTGCPDHVYELMKR